MSKSLNHDEDLDLLLSLQDRVLETPPNSPSPSDSPGTSSLKVDFFIIFHDILLGSLLIPFVRAGVSSS